MLEDTESTDESKGKKSEDMLELILAQVSKLNQQFADYQKKNDEKIEQLKQRTDAIDPRLVAVKEKQLTAVDNEPRLTAVEVINTDIDSCKARLAQLEASQLTSEEQESRLLSLERKLARINGVDFVGIRMETELWKHQLKNNLCVHGIPFSESEKLNVILSALLATINIRLAKNDVLGIHRAKPSHSAPGLIIFKLASMEINQNVLAARRRVPRISVAALMLKLKPGNKLICINQHLTPHMSSTFYMCRGAVAEGYFKSCWVYGDGIGVRLYDGSVSTMRSRDDVDNAEAKQTPIPPDATTSTEPPESTADASKSAPNQTEGQDKSHITFSTNNIDSSFRWHAADETCITTT